jgi:hypothetical protein
MLIALCEERRVSATIALRGPEYFCPSCAKPMILKKGRVVIHHFAHKPPVICDWARGETLAHLEAKLLLHEALTGRGLTAELEYSLATLPGDRRADVMSWSPKGAMVAIELQHTSISADDISARAFAYARAGAAQMWISFLPSGIWKSALKKDENTWLVRRYAPRQFELWIDGLTGKAGRWVYDPATKLFWLARMLRHEIHEEETIWYAPGGIEHYRAARTRVSRKYRDLTLTGPNRAVDLRIELRRRKAGDFQHFRWPATALASLVPTSSDSASEPFQHHDGWT